jgi:hypothetical protein
MSSGAPRLAQKILLYIATLRLSRAAILKFPISPDIPLPIEISKAYGVH